MGLHKEIEMKGREVRKGYHTYEIHSIALYVKGARLVPQDDLSLSVMKTGAFLFIKSEYVPIGKRFIGTYQLSCLQVMIHRKVTKKIMKSLF